MPLWRDEPTHEATWYYNLLNPLCQSINIWETIYYQQLHGDNPIVEWTKGTWLRIFLKELNDDEQASFLKHYSKVVKAAYPKQTDNCTLFPFRRLFMIGQL